MFQRHAYFIHDIFTCGPAWTKKIKKVNVWGLILQIPLLICLVLLFTPLHVFVYEMTDTIAIFKPMVSLLLLMDYFYLIAATVISIKNRKRASTVPEKKRYNSQIIFILFFTFSGLLIGFLMNLPAIELCVLPVVLKIFVELQDSQIYTDALTKLFNRRRMTELINEEITTCSEDHPLTVIMIDLDYFKSINDILGHDEGDRALTNFSRALRKSLLSKNAVASRWGGDEFVVAGKEKGLAQEFRKLLTTSLEAYSELPYMPQFSIGAYTCTSQSMTCDQILVEADAVLYKEKELRHSSPNNFIETLNSLKSST